MPTPEPAAPTPDEVALAQAMLRRHGINLEGCCWWCGTDQPYPCPIYTQAQATLAAADTQQTPQTTGQRDTDQGDTDQPPAGPLPRREPRSGGATAQRPEAGPR